MRDGTIQLIQISPAKLFDGIKAIISGEVSKQLQQNRPEATYLTVKEAADLLKVTVKTFKRYAVEESIRSYNLGPRVIRYRLSDIIEFVEKH